MLRNLAWQATDDLVRKQLSMFHGLADQLNLSEDDRRRALNLDAHLWHAWLDFVAAGPLPNEPSLPEMLCRLGATTYNLSVVAELDAVQTGNAGYLPDTGPR